MEIFKKLNEMENHDLSQKVISLIERTTDDKYLKDVVSDCVYRMKFRQPMFDYALAELAEFKKKMNGEK